MAGFRRLRCEREVPRAECDDFGGGAVAVGGHFADDHGAVLEVLGTFFPTNRSKLRRVQALVREAGGVQNRVKRQSGNKDGRHGLEIGPSSQPDVHCVRNYTEQKYESTETKTRNECPGE